MRVSETNELFLLESPDIAKVAYLVGHFSASGDVVFERGCHAWRVSISNRQAEEPYVSIGCTEGSGGRFCGVRLLSSAVMYDNGGDSDITGLLEREIPLNAPCTIDFCLDLRRKVLKIYMFEIATTTVLPLISFAHRWTPYISLCDKGSEVHVTWLAPSKFGIRG